MIKTLTSREIQILKEIIKGSTNKEIAQNLNISLASVKFYINNIFYKLEVTNRVTAAVKGNKLLKQNNIE